MPLLILIRHAKSDWSHDSLDDHARPLNARGRAAAPLIGRDLAARGLVPDQVLCSSALRTRQTWEAIAAELAGPAEADIRPALYHAQPEAMMDLLRRATGQVVAMIGHNPGIGALAHQILAARPAHAKFATYPTGATLIAQIDDWAGLRNGGAKLSDFLVPRDLPGHP
ncbi:SixA phosphatase family protein [Mangrovicoccus algicola]|uniref:Histidine phosphatase family protein n=1 Tax=Mangrovicoccus algicola TaxID=2771008 RepID=A0A8J7CUE5_9RHOB|nr:histidine phosphatase family protein [Mangrovicoccus algicola]MBE3637394.1 histidine phosphatase family protein [Mangrovicoccus algicola]